MVFMLVAVTGAQPWNNGRSDTQTQTVVVAADEGRARQRAASTSGSEGYDAWIMPGFVRVEVVSETTVQEVERTLMTDLQ